MLTMVNMRRGLVSPFDRVSPRFMPIADHHRTDEVMGYQPRPHSPLGGRILTNTVAAAATQHLRRFSLSWWCAFGGG